MKSFLIITIALITHSLSAQSDSISRILTAIEQHNEELSALQVQLDSRKSALQSTNNLPDPQLNAYYLPIGKREAGDYFEIEVSQSFEFPSIYKSRKALVDAQVQQLAISYSARRQEILLEAYEYCLELIYLNKLFRVEQVRTNQANTVYQQIQQLFEREQAGALELSKARVAWMQKQFATMQIQNRVGNVLLSLMRLNGGNPVTLELSEYPGQPDLPEMDSLWQEKVLSDPTIQQLEQQEQVALTKYQLSKKQYLPDITAGVNHQGVSGLYNTGIYAGVSIPLWANRHKEAAAQSGHAFAQANRTVQTRQMLTAFTKRMNDYTRTLERYRSYQETLSTLNSEELLLRAYELGEISFIEYYMELEFYRQAYDTMLEMEKTLFQQKAILLKHQL